MTIFRMYITQSLSLSVDHILDVDRISIRNTTKSHNMKNLFCSKPSAGSIKISFISNVDDMGLIQGD
jgi:hypothetical protein